MTTEVTEKKQIAEEHQIVASLNLAEALYSQLRSHRSQNNQTFRNLAMLMCSLLEHEILVNRGEEDDAMLLVEGAAAMASCIIQRLGFDVQIAPAQTPLEIHYYMVEFMHPERGSFEMRLSLPSTMPVTEYAKFFERRERAIVHQVRQLTREEWLMNPKPKIKKLQTPGVKAPKVRPGRFSAEEIALLELVENTGALQAYAEAQFEVSRKFLQKPISDIDKNFLVYVRSLAGYNRRIPPAADAQFEQMFEGKLAYYQSNQVVMIVANGIIRRFVPLFMVNDDKDFHVPLGYVPTDQDLPLKSVAPWLRCTGVEMKTEATLPKMKKVDAALLERSIKLSPRPAVEPAPEPAPINPPFDLSKAQFSSGALLRFASLVQPKVKESLEKDALALLGKAKEDKAISPTGFVRRAIKHGFEEVRYFKTGRWRFVVKEDPDKDIFKILTFEENAF